MTATTQTLRGYALSISNATGVTDPEVLAEIEDSMRNYIFNSTLDWQTPRQFDNGAREAHDLVCFMRSAEGVAEMEALTREMMASA